VLHITATISEPVSAHAVIVTSEQLSQTCAVSSHCSKGARVLRLISLAPAL
jgi:hypothetical protein